MKPVCFMVMPFQRKPVPSDWDGAPSEVDCNRLWDLAYRPALERLNYIPVRADTEPGAVIVKSMLDRLRHADLVLADVSLPNGNVYYEVGIRHVARETNCVLIAAEWSKPLFDLGQIRSLRFPLDDGSVPEQQAIAIRDLLVEEIPRLRDTATPYHVLVNDQLPEEFAEQAEQISSFQAELAALRMMPAGSDREASVRQMVKTQTDAAIALPEVALELLYLVRDTLSWTDVRDFVDSLPDAVRRTETVQEQYFLALSEQGDLELAVAGMEQLIRQHGPTPERCGILGGRYKSMYRAARDHRLQNGESHSSPDENRWLRLAIESYERGMMLDLNEYYCSCNLPALIRARGKKGDNERAVAIDMQVIAACRRAEARGNTDPFLPDTLFGTAFRMGDIAALEEIVEQVETGVRWRMGATLKDAKDWILQAPEEARAELTEILQRLERAYEQAH